MAARWGFPENVTDTIRYHHVSANYKGSYYYYEFNSEGICTTGLSGDSYAGPSFVVGTGVRKPGDEAPRTLTSLAELLPRPFRADRLRR